MADYARLRCAVALLCLQAVAAPLYAQQRELPKVLAISVEGERRYREDQLLAALGVQVGATLDDQVVSRGVETLWNAFKVRANVELRQVDGGVELRLVVSEMNVDLEPRFAGNDAIDKDTLLKWALLEERGELFLFQAERVRQRLLEGYLREGYWYAEVDIVRRGEVEGEGVDGPADVIFEIREGPQVNVSEVVLHGNDSMRDRGMWFWKDGLTKFASVQLTGPSLLDWNGEPFVQETLEADLLAMREVYRERGWLDAVVAVDRLEFSEDRTRVTVHVRVDEGRRYTVSSLAVKAVEEQVDTLTNQRVEVEVPLLFPAAELLDLCSTKLGGFWDKTTRVDDVESIREYYGDRGYLSHPTLGDDSFQFLDPDLVVDPANASVQGVDKLRQGRKRWIREILFKGATHTRDRVMRRTSDAMPGEVADLAEIRRTLSRLYSTGYFNDEFAPLEHRDPTFSFRSTPDPNFVDVEFEVEEGRVVNMQVQGGVDSNNGLFGRISLSMRNFDVTALPSSLGSTFTELYDKEAFHGAGQVLEIEYMPGTVLDAYSFRFLEPDIFRTHFDRTSMELRLDHRQRGFRFYDEERFEQRVRFSREFGRELDVSAGVIASRLDVDDLDGVPQTGIISPSDTPLPSSIYQQIGRTNLYGPTLDVSWTDLDVAINPREGVKGVLRNTWYGPFGGDAEFFKSRFDGDLYWKLRRASDDEVVPSFHLGLGLGLAAPYGDTEEVPYTERFQLGGSRILRGFAFRGVGPNNGENPLGGETTFDLTLEYRHPLYSVVQPGTYKEVETFRLTLFSDWGLLDPKAYEMDFSETRATWGFGVGMVTPFPVSLNFGFPILEGEGDRKQVFSFSLLNLSF